MHLRLATPVPQVFMLNLLDVLLIHLKRDVVQCRPIPSTPLQGSVTHLPVSSSCNLTGLRISTINASFEVRYHSLEYGTQASPVMSQSCFLGLSFPPYRSKYWEKQNASWVPDRSHSDTAVWLNTQNNILALDIVIVMTG